MSEVDLRITGHAGRITLTRPEALNALSYDMAVKIDAALRDWASDEAVKLVIIDAEGTRAFCAGGDIQDLYDRGHAGDVEYSRRFWRDEYRLNARIADFPKPYIAFMQGYTMGGGVGLACHGSHRVVGESSQIAMPEVGIGMVPDVGGSLLLARAPGRLGEYLALTATRMGPDDAIYAGFSDYYIPVLKWPDLIRALEETGDAALVTAASETPTQGQLRKAQAEIDGYFGGETLRDILNALRPGTSDFAEAAMTSMARHSPLAMACTVEMIHRLRGMGADIRRALALEYRYAYRAIEHSDFLEGIRAAVIDKDRVPNWRQTLEDPPELAATQMLMPLGKDSLTFEDEGDTR